MISDDKCRWKFGGAERNQIFTGRASDSKAVFMDGHESGGPWAARTDERTDETPYVPLN